MSDGAEECARLEGTELTRGLFWRFMSIAAVKWQWERQGQSATGETRKGRGRRCSSELKLAKGTLCLAQDNFAELQIDATGISEPPLPSLKAFDGRTWWSWARPSHLRDEAAAADARPRRLLCSSCPALHS